MCLLILFILITLDKFQVSSFNCTGIKSSVEYIAQHLCKDNDIIALQETWLLPYDLPLCDSIHPEFCAFATSSVDVGTGVVRGRPHGGLAFLYRRSIEPHVTLLTLNTLNTLNTLFTQRK